MDISPNKARPQRPNRLREEALEKLPKASDDIVKKYVEACAQYGMQPGIVRLFAVGSIVKDDGGNFSDSSDIDLVFSVEHPDQSLSSIPRGASSKSEAELELELRHEKLLEEFGRIWETYGIAQPLNIPHGETVPYPWGLPLKQEADFPSHKPGMLLSEYTPS